jgi:hypothetical protein
MWFYAHNPTGLSGWTCLVVLASLTALASAAHAQSVATLKGRVTDASGAIVRGAIITVRVEVTGVQRSATSDASGEYQFTFLPVGAYRVDIQAARFRPVVLPHLVVEVGRTIVQDFQLEVGGVGETVTVLSDVPLIEHSIAVGEIVDQRTMESIPLNGRKVLQLALLAPGSIDAPSGRSPHHAVARAGQRGD